MRRSVTVHSVVSFFFNTVLIAMAVNAAVAIAQQRLTDLKAITAPPPKR
jgi:hypothetical protein